MTTTQFTYEPSAPAPRTRLTAKCGECGRVFDMTNESDADEFASGHDCEV